MTSSKLLANGISAYFVLVAAALLHRLLAFAYLADALSLTSADGLAAFLVGAYSDIWVSFLGALLLTLVSGLAILCGFAALSRGLHWVFVSVWVGALAMHQAYVQFFHFQILPFHLRYLGDREFMQANAASLIGWRSVTIVGLSFGLWTLLLRWRVFERLQLRQLATLAALLTALCGWAHNRNINWRVNWFIAENLRTHPWERLYLHLQVAGAPTPLTLPEVNELAASLLSEPAENTDPASLFRVLTKDPATGASPQSGVSPIVAALRAEFAHSLAARAKPVIMVLLLESLRPAETGYFAPAQGESLTPALDALARSGIAFKQAFSTGSVTRGAQESTMCGYLGSMHTSLMRGEGVASVDCLPDVVRRLSDAQPRTVRGTTFWYHGGEGRFDNQAEFWRRHGVEHFLSQQDFPASLPHSSWGVSDKAFLARAAAELLHLRATSDRDFLLGLGLTVTNHIPWDVPSDAGPEVNRPRGQAEPNYRTTAYTDAAVGDFVAALRATGLWDQTLLILVSDHGNELPLLVDLYPDAKTHSAMQGSHVNLIVNGGLASRALAAIGLDHLEPQAPVSQADVAALIAEVAALPVGRMMGEVVPRQTRTLPVLSDLDEDLMDHSSNRVFSRTDVVKLSPAALPAGERQALLYYRALLEYIFSPTAPRRGARDAVAPSPAKT